jgi:1-acyl-sn-glycerol-3-phosphate acyltransferase
MPHDGRMTSPADRAYDELLAEGATLYPGVRIGRPGRARTFVPTIAAMRALRLRWAVSVAGSKNVKAGPAILVGNHVSALDPVVAVMSHWWRVTAFTKVEVFERRGAIFFRLMGQIPLRRGDSDATDWALRMAASTLADGNKVGLYPEGTRSPDPQHLHRLHPRVVIPLLRMCPDVPVHAICTTYPEGGGLRRRVRVQLSPRLDVDIRVMSEEQVMTILRDALLELGGQTYVDESAASAKRRAAAGSP